MKGDSLFLHQNGMDQLSIDAVEWRNKRNMGVVLHYKVPDKEFKRLWNVGREGYNPSRRHSDKYVVRERGFYRFTRYGIQTLKECGYELG